MSSRIGTNNWDPGATISVHQTASTLSSNLIGDGEPTVQNMKF